MPARGKITAQMPPKWVPNAAKRSFGFHETQNAFCLVKAVVIRLIWIRPLFPGSLLGEDVWDCSGAALGRAPVIG
jgi:hypothetical protein